MQNKKDGRMDLNAMMIVTKDMEFDSYPQGKNSIVPS